MNEGFLGVRTDDSIEGEDIRIRGEVEGATSIGQARAIRVEDDEVVGEVG